MNGREPDSTDAAGDSAATDPDGDLDVEFAVLGGPGDGPTLALDHERFAYAGKFVTSSTGKAVAREGGGTDDSSTGSEEEGDDVVAAASFDRDRTDPSVVRIRYVTVRRDRRGEGLGPRLLAFLAERALGESALDVTDGAQAVDPSTFEGVREVRIAVNNPFAYEAAYRAGFGFTGEETGLAELVLARPGDRSVDAYRRGLAVFREREEVEGAERAFLDERTEAGPPPTIRPPGDDA